MAEEMLTFDEVLAELQIEEDELRSLVSQGEIRGFREAGVMKFKRSDVEALKKGRETEPTIILSDSDAEITLPDDESEDLLIDEPGGEEDQATVLNIDVFEDADAGDDSGIPTVAGDSVDDSLDLKIDEDEAVTLIDDVEDEEDAATLIDVGGPTEMSTESFDLIEDAPQADDFEVVDTTISGTASRISRSARLRAMQIKKKKGHPIMTGVLFLTSAFLLFAFAVFFNTLRGTEPGYLNDIGESCRGLIDWITSLFAG